VPLGRRRRIARSGTRYRLFGVVLEDQPRRQLETHERRARTRLRLARQAFANCVAL